MEKKRISVQEDCKGTPVKSEKRSACAEAQPTENQQKDKAGMNTDLFKSHYSECESDLARTEKTKEESSRCIIIKQIDEIKDLKLQLEELRHKNQETETTLDTELRRNLVLEDELSKQEDRLRVMEAFQLAHQSDQEESAETTLVDEINLLLSIKDARISDLKRSVTVCETTTRESSQCDETARKVDPRVLLSQEEEIEWYKKQLEEKEEEAESLTRSHQQDLEKKSFEIEELKSALESTMNKRRSVELQKRHRRQLNAKNAKIKHLEGVVTALEKHLQESGSKPGEDLASDARNQTGPSEHAKLREEIRALREEKIQCKKELQVLQRQMEETENDAAEIKAKNVNKTQRHRFKEGLQPREQTDTATSRPASTEKLQGKLTKTRNEDASALQPENHCNKEVVHISRREIAEKEMAVNSHHEWEERKKLQKKIETLRTTLSKKNQELMCLKSEKQIAVKKTEDLQIEVSRLNAIVNSQQLEIKRLAKELNAAPDSKHVAEVLERLTVLEKEKNELDVLNERLERKVNSQLKKETTTDADSEDWEHLYRKKEEEAFELRLRKDQAEAQTQRLMQSNRDLFKQDAVYTDQESNRSTCHLSPQKRAKPRLSAEREQELLTTIATLTKALKRLQSRVSLKQNNELLLIQKKGLKSMSK